MKLFRELCCCCCCCYKIHKKTTVPESLLYKVIGFYPATSIKERTPIQVFFYEFCEIRKTPFLRNTSRRQLLFYEKIFYQQNNKKISEKRKKWKQFTKKAKVHATQKLNHYLHQVFTSFYC